MNSPEMRSQYIGTRSPDVFAESIAMITESAGCVANLVNLVGAVTGEGLSMFQTVTGSSANLTVAPTFGNQLSALSSGLGFERETI